MIRRWTRRPCPVPGATAYTAGELRAFVAQECGRHHMIISTDSGRYPTWDEIADARYDLLPRGLDFALLLPPPEDYVNFGNVFHLWEIHDDGLPLEREIGMPRTHENGIAVGR